MSFEVFTIPTFEKQAKKLVKKYASLRGELAELVSELQENPIKGTPIGKGFYKVRLSIKSKGKGKSGGARIITFIKITEETVFLSSIYDKSNKESLSDKELELIFREIP